MFTIVAAQRNISDAHTSTLRLRNNIKCAQGACLIGRKIGLTSQAMQQQLGVEQPDYGFLLDTMVVPSRGTLAFENFIQPRIEPEIAFWLASDLYGPGVTLEQVLQATRGV